MTLFDEHDFIGVYVSILLEELVLFDFVLEVSCGRLIVFECVEVDGDGHAPSSYTALLFLVRLVTNSIEFGHLCVEHDLEVRGFVYQLNVSQRRFFTSQGLAHVGTHGEELWPQVRASWGWLVSLPFLFDLSLDLRLAFDLRRRALLVARVEL